MDITIQSEYQSLIGELRQNRQIQLQTFFSAPIWISLFYGLILNNNNIILSAPIVILLPIPLLLANAILITNRRQSSDIIIAYIRTGIEEKLNKYPGWHRLLPKFRSNLKNITEEKARKDKIPQRFDINIGFIIGYLILCFVIFSIYISISIINFYFFIYFFVSLAAFLLIIWWNFHLSSIKGRINEAWRITFENENI